MPLDTPVHERPDERSDKRLDQKVALVTSSAPGICAETAMQLAREGAKVIVCGRNANQGLATVKQIRSEGGRATFVLADIAVIADVQSVIDETIATYGRLDILFNNVSNSYAQDGLLADVSESVWDRLIEPLLKGTFFCCQHALPFLQQSSSGTIINLIEKTPSSRNDSVSAVCQGGVLALTGAIAQQFAASSVTANVIWAAPFAEAPFAESPFTEAPFTESPFTEAISPPDAASPGLPEHLSALPNFHWLLSQVLTKPVAETEGADLAEPCPFADIAEAVMYLACYGSRLHGAALLVNTSVPRLS